MQRPVIYWLNLGAVLVSAALPALAIDDIGPTNRVWLQGVSPELEISGGFKNEGLLLLETIDDAFNINLLITTGAITNTTTGVVQINPGAGGNRGISANWFNDGTINVNYRVVLSRPSSFFYQRGSFNIASNLIVYVYSTNGVFNQDAGKFEIDGKVEFKGVTFNYNGGVIGGSPNLINSSLLISQTATNPATFVFNGPECQLLGNIPTNCFLEVQGSDLEGAAMLNNVGGFRNDGILSLDSTNTAADATLTVTQGGITNSSSGMNLLITTGAITNTTTGLVQINPGAGGNRGISANWFNDGTINVNYRADLSRTNGFFYQRGNFNIASNLIVYSYSTNGVFNQDAGNFEIEGKVEFKWITFNYNGGTIGGSPNLINSSLLISQTATNPATFVFNGPQCQLLGNNPTNCLLEVQGSDLEGAVVLSNVGGFRNDGILSLDSTNTAADATLTVTQGGINNSSSGIINIESGAGGQREIDADLINFGRISVNNVLTIKPPSGGITNAGELKLSADQFLMVKSDFVQALSGLLKIQLVEPEPGFEHEALNVAGTAQLDGLLEITLPTGFTPSPNATFVLLRCKKRVGFFSGAVVPLLPNQRTWKIDYRDQDVTLTVSPTMEIPSPKEFRLLSGDKFYLVFSGTIGGGYVLQDSADLIQWSNVRTNRPFSGVLEYVELNIKQIPHRFYRVIPAP